jgi:FlaA1/EpsC-like NDP-sugar epimerase
LLDLPQLLQNFDQVKLTPVYLSHLPLGIPAVPHDTGPQPAARYTFGVKDLGNLDWGLFLARPRLPSPSLEVLDTLYRQSMLVTGAGGSVGSALVLRLGAVGPSLLLALDSAESRLYKLQLDWAAHGIPGAFTNILGNVSDRTLLDEVFTVRQPRIVFHTAAFKSVALLEQQPLAAIQNNVFGTLTLTQAAAAHGARMVLVSTSKAVEPCSIMGVTKRLSEQIVLAHGGVVLRNGNVLGTRDSVTETFAAQIARGRALTVTDPAARRCFLTLDEAVNLLLIAAAEKDIPALMAPELPPAQFVSDLARFMAARLDPGTAHEIDFIGARPGDKQEERLWSSLESPRPALHPGLLTIRTEVPSIADLERNLEQLRDAVNARDLVSAVEQLRAIVPEYSPSHSVRTMAEQRSAS